jgi:DNA-directed RNA polymerase specialized sigma subunit
MSIYDAVERERKIIAKRLCRHLDAEEIAKCCNLNLRQVNSIFEETQTEFLMWLVDNLPEPEEEKF